MHLRQLGNTGLHVSEVAFGALTFGIGADQVTAGRLIDRYLELGGNFIDTANSYGPRTSEEVLGRLLKGRRNSVVLATKVRQAMGPSPLDQGLSRRHILQSVDASLARLQTDFIDLYQIHFWDDYTPVEETLEALDECVQSGKVRYLGCLQSGRLAAHEGAGDLGASRPIELRLSPT